MKYGISNLSIVPMRLNPSDKSEMINQMLFGEQYEILEIREKFSKIRLSHDGYEGWICNKQLVEIGKSYYDILLHSDKKYTTNVFDVIESSNILQSIVKGSVIYSSSSSEFIFNDIKYTFQGPLDNFQKKEMIVENVMMYLNSPYLWGGRSPFGIACSGLSQLAYRFIGVDLPRDACQQFKIGETLGSLSESKPGNLAFFENAQGDIIHVGIVLSNSFIIHASGKVRIDKINEKGILHKESGVYTHKLRLIKSII